MADRFAKHSAFRSTPRATPLFGEPASKPIKVTRDPPLRKVYYPPSEELGPAFDIPELVPPKTRLPPLESLQLCDVDYDGDKEVVTLPRKPRPKANHRERAAKREEKKRMVQKQSKALRKKSSPDIDHLVRDLCGGSDLPPVVPFTTQPVLPRVTKKTSDNKVILPGGLPGKKSDGKVDKRNKSGRQSKKDKNKKENTEYPSISFRKEIRREGDKSMDGLRTKEKEKISNPTPLPPVVSPELSQMLKEIEDVYAAHEKMFGLSASKTQSLKHDPLTAFQNRILALEDTVKGSKISRQPLKRTTPYPDIKGKSSLEIDLENEVTYSFDINEEVDESLTYTQSIPFMAQASQVRVPRKPLVSEPTRLGLLPKPPAFPKPPTTKGVAQNGFRRRRYQTGVQKKQNI